MAMAARAAALCAALVAALAAAAGGGGDHSKPQLPLGAAGATGGAARVHVLDALGPGGPGGAAGAEGQGVTGTVGGVEEEPTLDSEALAELGGGAAEWRLLWAGALAALRREPELNASRAEVLAQLGAPAFLHCPVRNLGERRVSWVRRRDWHIISSGLFMYTNDERFQVLHTEGSDDWVLQIKYVQKRDNGTYECQVPSRGGTLSRLVTLQVAVPEAFILGADEHHVDAGSTINLVCIIEKSPVPPQYVLWYHNARMINYDAAGGVSVRTEAGGGARARSALSVRRARPDHSGNYSCRAPNAQPAHILVYVSEGSDKMAATLSRGRSGGAPRGRAPVLAALALLALRPRAAAL